MKQKTVLGANKSVTMNSWLSAEDIVFLICFATDILNKTRQSKNDASLEAKM